jgi:hypothetical protein
MENITRDLPKVRYRTMVQISVSTFLYATGVLGGSSSLWATLVNNTEQILAPLALFLSVMALWGGLFAESLEDSDQDVEIGIGTQ